MIYREFVSAIDAIAIGSSKPMRLRVRYANLKVLVKTVRSVQLMRR